MFDSGIWSRIDRLSIGSLSAHSSGEPFKRGGSRYEASGPDAQQWRGSIHAQRADICCKRQQQQQKKTKEIGLIGGEAAGHMTQERERDSCELYTVSRNQHLWSEREGDLSEPPACNRRSRTRSPNPRPTEVRTNGKKDPFVEERNRTEQALYDCRQQHMCV